jgi:CheY-like chemotaxis protein
MVSRWRAPFLVGPISERAGLESRVSTVPIADKVARDVRVLVVDDEEILGRALARALCDFDVVVLGSAVEALDRVRAGETFDIILCDVMMPVMAGDDFYERVVLVAPELAKRIVFMTGGASESATAFLAKVPNRVIEKPFELKSLRAMIQDLSVAHLPTKSVPR